MGVLSSLIAKEFGVVTRVRDNPILSQVGVNPVQILRQNANRIGFTIVNLSVNTVFVWIDNRVSTVRGIRLAPNGGAVSLIYRDDFHMVGYEWWAVASAAASDIHIEELVGEGLTAS